VHLTLSRRRRRRGYSLVELLISMAMLGIIGSALAQIMMGQQRFYQRTVEQMAVRRELRTSINLLPAELRGLASAGGDLVDFNATSVTFRSTLGVSLVCAKSSTTSIDLPPLSSSKTITTAWYTAPSAGDTVFALRNDSSGVKGEFWSAHRITSVTTATSYCPASPFIDAVNDAAKARYRLVVSPVLPDSVVVSSPLRFTRTGKYALTQQPSGRYYLTRAEYVNGAWATAVPVSGPYMAPANSGGGMTLAFYDSTGVLVASAANATKVARVDLTLRAQGLSSSGNFGTRSTAVIDSVSLRIALRNRR
jgi:prepilin-type N-terminal cleavage/methylation domain-containing protein